MISIERATNLIGGMFQGIKGVGEVWDRTGPADQEAILKEWKRIFECEERDPLVTAIKIVEVLIARREFEMAWYANDDGLRRQHLSILSVVVSNVQKTG